MQKLRDATLLFLIKKQGGEISEVCLALKKRGFGQGRWNGVGGKVDAGESIEAATQREAQEEIGITAGLMEKVAELTFIFPRNPAWDQVVHTYVTENWQGEPAESEEMRPAWFAVRDTPFASMWPDDIFWLPQVLAGKHIRARFTFAEHDVIVSQEMEIMEKL